VSFSITLNDPIPIKVTLNILEKVRYRCTGIYSYNGTLIEPHTCPAEGVISNNLQ